MKMTLNEIVDEINALAKYHHQWEDNVETSGAEYDAMLLIAKYILNKGYDQIGL